MSSQTRNSSSGYDDIFKQRMKRSRIVNENPNVCASKRYRVEADDSLYSLNDNTDNDEGSSIDQMSSSNDSERENYLEAGEHYDVNQHPRKWTPEEDQALQEAVIKHGEMKWNRIASYVGTRNHGK
jgi:hypothetical protein